MVLSVRTMSMLLSPAQAALATGVSRWTVVRAINAGDLRATRDNRNAWRIKPEELEAWRSAQSAQGAHSEHEQPPALLVAQVDAAAREEAAEFRAEVRVLHAKLAMLEDQLARERAVSSETISDLRKRLDQEQEERRNLQGQLTALVQSAPETAQEWPRERLEASEPLKAPRGFLARLLGR